MIARPCVGVSQQPDHVIGEELAIEDEHRVVFALLLMEQFLELGEELGEVGAEPVAPVHNARIRDGQKAHEDVRAADAIPARLARQADRLAQSPRGAVGKVVKANGPAGLKHIVRGTVGGRHCASFVRVSLE